MLAPQVPWNLHPRCNAHNKQREASTAMIKRRKTTGSLSAGEELPPQSRWGAGPFSGGHYRRWRSDTIPRRGTGGGARGTLGLVVRAAQRPARSCGSRTRTPGEPRAPLRARPASAPRSGGGRRRRRQLAWGPPRLRQPSELPSARGASGQHVAEHRADPAGDRGHPGLRAALHAVR